MTATTWRTSTWCAASECVQVARPDGHAVLVRDSAGRILRFTAAAWRDMLARVKAADAPG